MRSPRAPRRPWLGIFALVLCACPGDDEGGPTTSGAPSSNGETAQPGSAGDAPPPTTGSEESTAADTTSGSGLRVTMETSLGTLVIELDEEAAPVTVANFLAYVEAGFYDGGDGLGATIFHRVVPAFVVQGGGYTEAYDLKTTMAPIVNESDNGLSNRRGTIAMARTDDLDSATSQFYLNTVDNGLDLDGPDGYAVFGELVEGLDVMDAIEGVEIDGQGVPLTPVIILSAAVQ